MYSYRRFSILAAVAINRQISSILVIRFWELVEDIHIYRYLVRGFRSVPVNALSRDNLRKCCRSCLRSLIKYTKCAMFPTQIYRNRNKHCNGQEEPHSNREREREAEEAQDAAGARKIHAQIGLQFQTHVGCAQIYIQTFKHRYISLREESKNANTRPAEIKIKNCVAKNKCGRRQRN